MRKNTDEYLEDSQLRKEILRHLEESRYRLTRHADEELKKDDLDLKDILYILKTGSHNKLKTQWNNRTQTWRYAIQGKTKEQKREARIIIAFVDEMLIITVMEI
ncbi:MAG TPA: DUF4258 domain-containing protein [Rhabdochlamydiaceae bacterium]|nr:DUF4258 domain-containing protein [Rhabdochlamydiaceae bacterium]